MQGSDGCGLPHPSSLEGCPSTGQEAEYFSPTSSLTWPAVLAAASFPPEPGLTWQPLFRLPISHGACSQGPPSPLLGHSVHSMSVAPSSKSPCSNHRVNPVSCWDTKPCNPFLPHCVWTWSSSSQIVTTHIAHIPTYRNTRHL